MLPNKTYASVTTAAQDTTVNVSTTGRVSDSTAQQSVNTMRNAVEQIDRSFDNPTAFLGPNPTQAQLNNYWNNVQAYRRALPGMYGSFNNLDQLLGGDAGQPGIITQGVQAANQISQLMSTLSNGQFGGSAEIQGVIQQLQAAENVVNLVSNFGNTGLGTMQEGALALQGITQLFPGLNSTLQPVVKALGAFNQLSQMFGGAQQSFANLGSSIPSTVSSLNSLSSSLTRGSGSTIPSVSMAGRAGYATPEAASAAAAARATGAKAADAATKGEAVKTGAADAAKDPAVKDAADKGAGKDNDKSGCVSTASDSGGSSGGAGVPTIEKPGELMRKTEVIRRNVTNECKNIFAIKEIQTRYFAKELDPKGTTDANASEQARLKLEAERQKFTNQEKELFLKDNKEKGPAKLDIPETYYNEIRARRAKNTIADTTDILTGESGRTIVKMLNESEKNAYDEKANLKAKLGMASGGNPEQEYDQAKPWQQALMLASNADRYSPASQMQIVASEMQLRKDDAVKIAQDKLYWGEGWRDVRECAKEDSQGNCRLYKTITPGTIVKQAASDLYVSSNIAEGVKIDKDTETKRADQPANVSKQVASGKASGGQNGSGGGLSGIMNTITQLQGIACSVMPDSSLCGGGNNNNGGGGGGGGNDSTPTAPAITFSDVTTDTIDGSPLSKFTWDSTDTTKCYAQNDWITYGDTEVSATIRSPRSATTTFSVMAHSGTEVPVNGQAVVFHPLIFKASATSTKAAANSSGIFQDFTHAISVIFQTDANGTFLQRSIFRPLVDNLEVNDIVMLNIPGGVLSMSVRTPVSIRSVAGALYSDSAGKTETFPNFKFSQENDSLLIDLPVPSDITLPSDYTYRLRCTGAGGEASKSITVPFATNTNV